MASSAKPSTATAGRRKSSKPSMIVKLKLSPKLLQTFEPTPAPAVKVEVKEESPSKDLSSTNTVPVATSTNSDNPSESNANTPVAVGTPGPSSMPPPTEAPKRKQGVKRSGPALGPDGLPKPRGKPGPKKKARLEDGSIDHSATIPRAANGTAHKLGPKANQGAINEKLRALDRTGKPTRKWQKASFKLKSFTGVVWEIPRWTAPPKVIVADANSGDSTSGDSSKENKENSQIQSEKSEKSNGGTDVDMGNNNVSSPAPSIPKVEAAEDARVEAAP